MKKLLLVVSTLALILAIAPLATAESAEAPVALEDATAAVDVESATLEVTNETSEGISAEDLATLKELFGVTETSIIGPCIDSGIHCFSASDCTDVCAPLTCKCFGTCVYCG